MGFRADPPLGPKSNTIKLFRLLLTPSGRNESGLFLAEGTNAVREIIATQWETAAVCCTEKWRENFPNLCQALQNLSGLQGNGVGLHGNAGGLLGNGVGSALGTSAGSSVGTPKLHLVTTEALSALTESHSPDGVVAICKVRNWELDSQSFEGHGILLDGVQDPGNLGTLIRSTASTAGAGVWLTPNSVDPLNAKVIRSATGQIFRTPVTRWKSRELALEKMHSWKENGVCLAAAACAASRPALKCLSLWETNFPKHTLFLLGNEANGLADDMLGLAHIIVEIPMHKSVESLNVGVAGSLLLYEYMRQHSDPILR